jgi:hypothetical protein
MAQAVDRRSTFEILVDLIVDRIVIFTDYFIVKKHVTLSETTLLCFSLAWSLWFIFRGTYVAEVTLGQEAWAVLFTVMATAHVVSFFFKNLLGRAAIATCYAVVWCFMTFFSFYTGSTVPAVPTLSVITFLSVFIAVRLFRDWKQSQQV